MPILVPGQTLASREPTLRVENVLAPGSYVFRMTVVDDSRNESAPTEITVRVQRVVVGPVVRDPIRRDPLRPILRPGGPT